MKYQVQNAPYLSEFDVLQCLKKGADLYLEYAETDLLFIFRQSKQAPYDFYEIHFGIENFMHLAGIQSETIRAKNFLNACANGKVKIGDCKPRHSVSNRNSKVMLLGQLLDFRHSKCYKIGEKDLVTKDNDFEMAIGNTSGVVGFDPRVSKKGSKEIDKKHLPIPITLLTNPITSYSSRLQKIMFILKRTEKDTYYNTIFYEIKNGLLKSEAGQFPHELQQKIDEKLYDEILAYK